MGGLFAVYALILPLSALVAPRGAGAAGAATGAGASGKVKGAPGTYIPPPPASGLSDHAPVKGL